MKNYLKFKGDIEGFQDVLDTVKTVEKIAAASIHDLKAQVQTLQSYKQEIAKTLDRFSSFRVQKNHPLLQKNKQGQKWLIIIGGDKGLVGGLYNHLINTFLQNSQHYQKILVIGQKINAHLEEEGVLPEKVFPAFSDLPTTEEVKAITDFLFSTFINKKFATLDILYPSFVSLAEQNPVTVPFLPFDIEEHQPAGLVGQADLNLQPGLPIFEPTKQIIFDLLLEKYISVYLYEFILEAKLSEFGARTVSMENASGKTKKFITKLKSSFIKERRKNITQKQLESFTVHNML